MQFRIHVSSVCADTWLCTNSVHRVGSRPAAIRKVTVRRVRAAKLAGVVGERHRVQVDDAVERLVGGFRLVEGGHPVPERAEVVAEMDLTGGLDPRKDTWHGA